MNRFLTFLLALFLGVSSQAQEENDILLTVGGQSVTTAEFLHTYQKHEGDQKENLSTFLERFMDYKVKVASARQMGLDTLSVVRNRLAYFQKCLEAGQAGVASTVDDGGLTGPSLYIGHLLLPLPQHTASSSLQFQLKERMDSVYRQILDGEDFMTVVNAVSPKTRNEYWISRNQTLADVEEHAYRLKEGEMSQPFLSYDGYHLLKVFRRSSGQDIELTHDPDTVPASDPYLLTEYQDGLLLNELYKRHQAECQEPSGSELTVWFEAHRKDYEWDIPHYKGVVYHCMDKKTFKQLQKLFKKNPMDQWTALLQDGQYASLLQKAQVSGLKLYTLSQDPYVDQLAFGGPKAPEMDGYPFTGISGKKLRKGPEDYQDVKDQVKADFEKARELSWMENLRKQVTVNLNQKAFDEIKEKTK